MKFPRPSVDGAWDVREVSLWQRYCPQKEI